MTDVTLDAGAVRAAALLGPIIALAVLVRSRPVDRSLAAGALLATVWNLAALLGLNAAAQAVGWWQFVAEGGVAAGIPIDLLLGWMVLWGAVPVLAFRNGPMLVPVAVFLLVDVALMPLADPVVVLGETWLIGEAVGLAVGLMPAVLLGRWTAQRRRLPARAAMQVALSGALLLWVLPLLALGAGGGLPAVVAATAAPLAVLAVLALTMAALLGVAAVQEFCERGQGTPLPFDPPLRLVRSGPYAYIRNPMQTSVCLILGFAATVSGSGRLGLAAVVATAYGAGLAMWHEGGDLHHRFGDAWWTYTRSVRAWWPSWRPSMLSDPGTLWVAGTCEQCATVSRFFARRNAVALHIRRAEDHPGGGLRRIAYESAGQRWQGVAAVAQALQHIHLGWALAGWILRLPLIVQGLQLLVDAAGGGPRDLSRAVSARHVPPDVPSCGDAAGVQPS